MKTNIVIRVRVAWWVRYYLSACALFVKFGGKPNLGKVGEVIRTHGVKVVT